MNKLAEQLKAAFVHEGVNAKTAEKYTAEATCKAIINKTTQNKIETVLLATECQTIAEV